MIELNTKKLRCSKALELGNKLFLSEILKTIDPMHKWLPIKNYFVSIKISPTNLAFELIIQRNFYFQTRHTKEF